MNALSEYLMSDSLINPILDGGYLPHSLIRLGIRRQLSQRLQEIATRSLSEAYDSKMRYVKLLRERPIAIETKKANEQHYEITAFSNSRTQKEYIDAVAKSRGFTNLTVITGDAADYEFEAATFDRVVSIEMFEHMKNYQLLLEKVSRALMPGGKLFLHIFCHKDTPYDFEGGWMSEFFFTGGTMPSADLLLYFQSSLSVQRQWWVNGQHYAQTCEDWLKTMLRNKDSIWPALVGTYGEKDVVTWWNRWQIFYLACAELFKWESGDTWGVTHLLFEKKA
ncbi:hypothetical protein SLS60_003400 [Paraconiothyrium brasiliense]|uniref:Uncharacterized protein n=1 Tax=Paraconiothyrium brasiliense TaxID=300254 RepID=A0ABR3RW27_9PLEO